MAELRTLRAGIAQPVVQETARLTSNSSLYSGAIQAVGGVLDTATESAGKRAVAAQEAADAAVLGQYVADTLDDQVSFLANSVEQEIDQELAEAAEEGVTAGETGRPVLEEAHRLQRVASRLQQSGRLSDFNEMRLMMRQSELIRRRPDLAINVLDLTKKAVTESRDILDRVQTEELAAAAALRTEERSYLVEQLQKYDIYDASMSLSEMRQNVAMVQSYAQGKRQDEDTFLQLQREDQIDGFDASRDERDLAFDTRAREREARRLMDSSWLPNLTLTLADQAVTIANKPVSATQRLADWQALLATERANIGKLFRNPAARAEAQAELAAVDEAYRGLIDGTADNRSLQNERADKVNTSWLKLMGATDESIPAILEISRDLEPFLQGFLGQQAGQLQQQIGTKLTAGLEEAGFLFSNTEIEGIDTTRRPRQPLDNGATNPYLLQGQQPRQVTERQIRTTTRNLLDVSQAIALAPSDQVLPGHKEVATQAVIEALANPAVREDPVNIRLTLQGVANQPKLADAFNGARKQQELVATTLAQTSRFFTTAGQALARQAGVSSLLDIGEVRQTNDGRLVLVGTSLDRLPVRSVQQFNTDLNTSVRAWAHANGHVDYPRAASELLGQSQ